MSLVDGVAGGAGDVVHDDALRARQAVEQARLAHVGAPDERDPSRTALRVGPVGRHVGQHLEHGVEGVAAPAAVHGGHREGLAEAEAPQHRRVGLAPLVVDLVGHEHHRLAGAAQEATTASSSSVAPTVASTTNMTTSARSIAISACSATRRWMPVASASQPPVSTIVKRRPPHSAS